MSWQTLVWAKAQRTGTVGRKAVLMALAEYADERHSCNPSQETLAYDTEQGLRTVRQHVSDLEAAGLIAVERVFADDGKRQANRYFLRVAPEADFASGQPEAGTEALKSSPLTREVPSTSRAASGAVASGRAPLPRPVIAKETGPGGRPRNPIWDAVVEVCGLDGSKMTRSEAAYIGKTVGELRKVEATPDQIYQFARWWRATYPSVRLTAGTITKHWSARGTVAGVPTDYNPATAWMYQ